MFRVYYQENSGHGAFLGDLPGKFGTTTVATGGILERGIAPLPSTRYTIDRMNQVVVPRNGERARRPSTGGAPDRKRQGARRGGREPTSALAASAFGPSAADPKSRLQIAGK
jgi:hypothetical protein